MGKAAAVATIEVWVVVAALAVVVPLLKHLILGKTLSNKELKLSFYRLFNFAPGGVFNCFDWL